MGKSKDIDAAKLRLAFIKENPTFRNFYERLSKEPYSTCPEIRRPDDSYGSYIFRVDLTTIEGRLLGGIANELNLNPNFIVETQAPPLSISPDILIEAFNLKEDIRDDNPLIPVLYRMFYISPVMEIEPRSIPRHMSKNEMILVVDLKGNRTDILNEVDRAIKRRLDGQNTLVKLADRIQQDPLEDPIFDPDALWEPDVSRQRIEEGWEQLKIWKLRKKRYSFQYISDEVGISTDLAKKRYYRAYEKVMLQPYDPEIYRKLATSHQLTDLTKTCGTCTDRSCLKDIESGLDWVPCPDVDPYVNQDQIKLREKLTDIDRFTDIEKLTNIPE